MTDQQAVPAGSGMASHPLRAKPFPIQRGEPIPWEQAEWGYRAYAALYGTDQSLNRLAERGGFGKGEMTVCARDTLDRAARLPHLIPSMRSNIRGLPNGERPAEVPKDLAEQVDALLDGSDS